MHLPTFNGPPPTSGGEMEGNVIFHIDLILILHRVYQILNNVQTLPPTFFLPPVEVRIGGGRKKVGEGFVHYLKFGILYAIFKSMWNMTLSSIPPPAGGGGMDTIDCLG